MTRSTLCMLRVRVVEDDVWLMLHVEWKYGYEVVGPVSPKGIQHDVVWYIEREIRESLKSREASKCPESG